MNKTINKAKWPYLLLLAVCMIAATVSPEAFNKTAPNPLITVSVQVEKESEFLVPFSEWLVQLTTSEVDQ